MLPQWTIEKKRDGLALTQEEIGEFVSGFADGAIPDYQMAALCMAVFFRGMTDREISDMTDAMIRSGTVLDTTRLSRPVVDKHSTGGIGDKVSLVLAPLAASCGLAVPMISGRGLGITGGTLDKLEAIPGYRTSLTEDEFLRIVDRVGCSIMGQTETLAPADRKLYALRDVTATVPSIPLIVASIMSKKMAEGLGALVLDIKCGCGAFMRTLPEARSLAQALLRVATARRTPTAALLTDMNEPLGRTAGNAVEVREAVDCLRGHGPADLEALSLRLAAHMLLLSGMAGNIECGEAALRQKIASGAALEAFAQMIAAHGGDAGIVDNPGSLPTAHVQRPVKAPRGGVVARADAERMGRACLVLGAGRRKTTDAVDHAVGLTGILKVGEPVSANDALAVIHARSEDTAREAEDLVQGAYTISDSAREPRALITATLGGNDGTGGDYAHGP